MNVCFCHDGPLIIDNKNNLYGIAHTDELFERYFYLGDSLSLFIRLTKEVEKSKIVNLSKINTFFIEIYDTSGKSRFSKFVELLVYKKNLTTFFKNQDIIISRLPSVNGYISQKYARKYKIPIITEVVTCPWDSYWNHSLIGKLFAPIAFLNTRKIMKNAKYSIYVTKNFLQDRYPTNGYSRSISNVVLPKIDDKILHNRLKKIKTTDFSSLKVATIGSVDLKFKGQEYIIKVMNKLYKSNSLYFDYYLVGSGNGLRLKKMVKRYNLGSRVHFLGVMKHNEIFEFLKEMDIYTQPSRQEGLPRALIEAMSLGLPCFGATTAGIPELLSKSRIFNNNYKNITQIIKIMDNFNIDSMSKDAIRNFKRSLEYSTEYINNERKDFYDYFLNSFEVKHYEKTEFKRDL